MGSRKWSEVKDAMEPARRAEVDAAVREELFEMELRELCEASGKTQAELAEIADTVHAELAKFAGQEDPLLAALRRYVSALGGELEVAAVFKNKRIPLKGV